MACTNDDWAVFWCSLLGPILLEGVASGERSKFLRDLSQREVVLPNGQCKRISLSTFKRKVRRFRQRKIEGLRRQPRSDRGRARKRRQEMLERAIALKKEQPRRSPQAINKFLQQEFGRTIPRSTLNRHLRRAGATRRKLGVTQEKIRCRWTRDHSNALWVGDFADGPCVFHADQVVKSHLSIWIDCHSRYVVEGRYYFRENLDILIDSLLRAWASHGASRELYVDNAKVYHSNSLRLACAQLNIDLLHRPPRDPSPGGIIERVIQTTQHQFESEIRASHTISLDEMNRYFQAWLHASYHETAHSATGQTPKKRFHEQTRFHRVVNLSEAMDLFCLREKRKVDHEFCDVRINNQFFAVDVKYRGDSVFVSFDPHSRLDEVRVLSLEGEFLQVARRYERQRGTHPHASQVERTSQQTPLDHEYLKLLEARHQQQLQDEAKRGIDYHQARYAHVWSLPRFGNALAKLLGRKGGISGLSTQELELLEKFHRRHPGITATLLEQAFERAELKTIPVVLFHLQQRLPR
jgi:transposase InsO family protein